MNKGSEKPLTFEGNTMGTKPKTKVIYRDAESGEFVKKKYAEQHPKTTEKEHRPVPKKKK